MVEEIKVLINEKTLQNKITELAQEISNDYENEDILLICVLKGAAFFTIDLAKKLTCNSVFLDFMQVSSYENQTTESTGEIKFKLDINTNIKNRNVIIVEDIIDSGYTLNYLYNYLQAKNPKTLKICTLLDKKERRKMDIKVHYTGFEVENKFVVGYGLDYNQKYRNLPYIGYLDV